MTVVSLYVLGLTVAVWIDPLPRWKAARAARQPIDDVERFAEHRAALREVTGR